MAIVDQGLSVRVLQERLDRTQLPRHRTMLETLLEHLDAEAANSLERLMATLVPEPAYHLWSNGTDNGPKDNNGVRAYYGQLVAEKRGILEFDITRVVVDDDCIVTEGWIRAINTGPIARARGYEIEDDGGTYLVTSRVVIFWPFNQAGQMVGEDGYATWDPTSARALDESELPETYRQLVAAG